MTQVAKITEQQAQELIGQEFAPDSFFHPIQDADGYWVVSVEESAYLSFDFELIEFHPIPNQEIL